MGARALHGAGLRLLRALVTLPLVLPPVVGGVALLLVLGRNGLIGQWLDAWFGLTLPFTTAAVVLAETFVAMPFLVVAVESAFRSADRGYDEAAATLGAGRLTIFWRVSLPLIRPALVAGAVLCWARALGEFGATVTFAGNLQGVTRTMPLSVYLAMETDPEAAVGPLAGAARRLGRGAVRPPGSLDVHGELGMSGSEEAPSATSVAGLRYDGIVRRATFELAVAFSVAPGEVLGVLGPNGAGKSTLLRAIAGLTALEAGSVQVDGQVWQGPGRFVPAEERRAGVVFQDYRLFPHLDVRDNVAFAARSAGSSRAASRAIAEGWLARLGLGAFAHRRPAQLSGGQAQGVALARALARDPAVLLLDEPMAALDAGARIDVRRFLREHLAEFAGPVVLVTHDPLEAMVLADRILVIEGGRLVQEGPPTEVARRPASPYVARLVGLNLWEGHLDAATGAVALAGGGLLRVVTAATSGRVLVSLRPSAITVHTERPVHTSTRNLWQGRVGGMELLSDRVRLQVEGEPSALVDVTPAAVSELGLEVGGRVWLSAKATEAEAYPGSGSGPEPDPGPDPGCGPEPGPEPGHGPLPVRRGPGATGRGQQEIGP